MFISSLNPPGRFFCYNLRRSFTDAQQAGVASASPEARTDPSFGKAEGGQLPPQNVADPPSILAGVEVHRYVLCLCITKLEGWAALKKL
jgi:hypothetical protein